MGYLCDTLHTFICFHRLDIHVNDLVNQDT